MDKVREISVEIRKMTRSSICANTVFPITVDLMRVVDCIIVGGKYFADLEKSHASNINA